MAAVPWYTSDDLVAAVQRKISFPISQNTFSDTDILAFANEEVMISQVPSILEYHEEYFVTTALVPIVSGQNRYSIPSRAIGMRLRGLFYQDNSGNVFEMSRISSDDRAYFQDNSGSNAAISKFFFEGNDVVLTPLNITQPSGSLLFVYYLRPNQLVPNDRAAIISGFSQTILVNNASIVNGDTITILSQVFTAKASPSVSGDFLIGANSVATATNLVTAINLNGVVTSSNGSPSISLVTLVSSINGFGVSTSNSSAFVIPSTFGVQFSSIPSNITGGTLVDFLQTSAGHKTYAFDVLAPVSGFAGTIINFASADVPQNAAIGDYVCSSNECIIPQIPTDLHTGLAERTCARILVALGSLQEAQAAEAKIKDIDMRQGTLLDQRGEGNPQKILARKSILRYAKIGSARRF